MANTWDNVPDPPCFLPSSGGTLDKTLNQLRLGMSKLTEKMDKVLVKLETIQSTLEE